MGMCAIYTAIPPPPPEELLALARTNEASTYGANRCTLGRRAVAELVALCAPPSHAAFARTVLDGDLWGFLTPAASRGNHAATLQRVHEHLVVPVPLWPASPALAWLTGAEPAHYIGNNLAMLPPYLLEPALAELAQHEAASEIAAYFVEFLHEVQRRGDAVLLHWDYR